MKVLKFGGTSVGSVESLKNVKQIVEAIPGHAIVVVSALGGITDALIALANSTMNAGYDLKPELAKIASRHNFIIENVVEEEFVDIVKEKIATLINSLSKDLELIYKKHEISDTDLDNIVSYGERMSSVIVAAMLKNGRLYYSPDFIKTEKWLGKNIANRKLTDKLIKQTFSSINENEKSVVPGFISTDTQTGELTNLGRGGSDFTGALIAASLNAEVLEIWTDVDGFMTADPRIVKEAEVIDHLTFTESMELCSFGAKVIYPPTIFPVFHKNIPIKILNTFNPSAKGTLITDHSLPEDRELKGVTSLNGISLITLGKVADSIFDDVAKRALNILSRQSIRLIPMNSQDAQNIFSFAVSSSDSNITLELLNTEFKEEITQHLIDKPILQDNLTALAIVGKELNNKIRLASRIRHSLLRDGIKVEATSTNNSKTTLIYIIEKEKSSKALPLIHSLLFS